MNRRAFASTCLLLATLACSKGASTAPQAEASAKTLYLVRHAEKQIIEGESDPELTEDGHARAAALPSALDGIPIDTIYSSDYRRTQQTVAPYAEQSGLSVLSYDPGDPAAFAETLRTAKGQHILVAGHSNTIPSLVDALGASAPTIEDGQYGDLFVLSLDGEGARLELRHFGR